jgi:CRP/FNR family transcriptional regulator, anaerobic regulatory protein
VKKALTNPLKMKAEAMEHLSASNLRRLLGAKNLSISSALDKLGQEVLVSLAAISHLQTAFENDVITIDGVVDQKVGYLLDGVLAMVKQSSDKRAHVVGLLLPTDLFGRMTGDPTPHRLVAVARSRLLIFDREAFDVLLQAHPDLERLFLVSVLDELDAARDWILLLSGTSVLERVASFLVMLARRQDAYRPATAPLPMTVVLPMSRKHVGQALAIRHESISRALHALADRGVIRIVDPVTFEINDLDALVNASSQDPAPRKSAPNGADRGASKRP